MEPSEALISRIRSIYPQGFDALHKTIRSAGDGGDGSGELTDVEVHADRLRLTTRHGAEVDVPFDVAGITPPGATDLLLDHGRQTILCVDDTPGPQLPGTVGRHYRMVEGGRQPIVGLPPFGRGSAEHATRLRAGVRPVLMLRRSSRLSVLKALDLDDATSLRRRLAGTRVVSGQSVAAMSRPRLLDLVGELREYEFLAVFVLGDSTAVALIPESLDEVARLVRTLSRPNAFLFSRERARRLDLGDPDYRPRAATARVVGFFPGLGSRIAYQDVGWDLIADGGPEVAAVYDEAARTLGLPGRPDRLVLTPENLPDTRIARQGFIGAAILVHGIALERHLRALAARAGIRFEFAAYTGESFGIITSAVASGSLSVADGVRIAHAFTPLMLQAAEGVVDGGAFEREIASYLGPVRGRALVPELYHMVGLVAEPGPLADLLDTVRQVLPPVDVEVNRAYSARRAYVYVRTGARDAFDRIVGDFPSVTVTEHKAPTRFLVHSWQMAPARTALARFIDDNGIVFGAPRTPIVANHGGGLLTTAAEIREGVLAITDQIMASRTTVRAVIELAPHLVLELGPGGRSLALLADNDAAVPMTGCTGTAGDVEAVLRAMQLMDELTGELEELYVDGDRLNERHHHLLRMLFQAAAGHEFAQRYFYQGMERVISTEMLRPRQDGAPAFHAFLEVFQHTRRHLAAVDIERGELVVQARLKRPYVEMTVLEPHGTLTHRNATAETAASVA
jgi:hypothetical protein